MLKAKPLERSRNTSNDEVEKDVHCEEREVGVDVDETEKGEGK